MRTTRTIDILAAGMAIFAMFFGAGNIIFPLALGQLALDKTFYAFVGLLITAVAIPFIGLITMFLYQGQMASFFGKLGKVPGLLIPLFIITILGPLGCAPRNIALAYSTYSMSFDGMSLVLFSLVSCAGIFLFAFDKGRILPLVGYILSPLKIFLLLFIIVLGFIYAPQISDMVADQTRGSLFLLGLKEGYNTMDLLASFFMAPLIIASIAAKNGEVTSREVFKFFLKACVVGIVLLSGVYVGFCYLTYIYAPQLEGVTMDQLLGAIAYIVLGPKGGTLATFTVVATCFTTAIAQVGMFSGFVQSEIFGDRVRYVHVVVGSILLTFFVTTMGFQGIVAFLAPVLEIAYPLLIVLTFYNLYQHLFPTRQVLQPTTGN